MIQFAGRSPGFNDALFTSVENKDACVLRAEIGVLLEKDEIQPVPPTKMMSEFYSPYFILPKKSGRLVMNQALHKLPFKVLMQKYIPSHAYTFTF